MQSCSKILVVDDNPMVRELIADFLQSWGYGVVAEASGREALESFTKQGPWQLVILDLRMPGMSGLELLEKMREGDPQVEVIIVTAHADVESAIQAIGLGVFDYLTKPIVPNQLKHRVERALDRYHLVSEQKELLRELKERIQQRTRALEAVKEIAVSLIGPDGLNTLLDLVLAKVLGALGGRAGVIYLIDEERGELVPMACRGFPQEVGDDLVQRRIRVGEGLCGQVAERGDPVFIAMDTSGDPRIASAPIKMSGINSYLSVPLRSKGKVVGVFSVVASAGETCPLSTEDLELVATIGHQLGVAIENARLFEEIRRKSQKLSALNQISRIVTSTLEKQQVFDFIVQAAVQLLEASVSTLWLLEESGELTLQASAGQTIPISRPDKIRLQRREGLVGSVIQEKVPVVLFDYQGDPRLVNQPWVQAEGLRAFAGVPLLLEGKCLGVLTVARRAPRPFREDEVEILTSFANQAATAIENARLFQEITRSKALWENTFDSVQDLISVQDGESRLLKVNKPLAGRLKASPQELIGRHCSEVWCGDQEPGHECPLCQTVKAGQPLTEEVACPHLGGTFVFSAYPLLDRRGEAFGSIHIARDITKRKEMEEHIRCSEKLAAVGQLAAGLAHEVGNAIAIIGGATQFLMKSTERDHQFREFLEVIDRSVTTAAGVIRDLLSFASPRPPVFQLLDIRTILDKTCLLVKGRCEGEGIRIQKAYVQTPLQVQGDAEQLEQVVVNLILNAVQAMPRGGMLTLAASVDAEGGWVRIEIADTGMGIPPEYLDKVFDPFFTTKEGGTGLGLSVTYRIVQAHGGRMTVESREEEGTRFTISLPASQLD